MMNCQKAKEYIDLYIDERLSKDETDQLLLHTQSCPSCKAELERAIALKKAFDGLGEIEPPAGLAASAIKKAKKRTVPFYAYATAGVAVAAALIAVFASGVLFPMRSEDGSMKTNDSVAYDMAAEEEMGGAADDAAPAEMPQEAPMMEFAMEEDAAADVADEAADAADDSAADEDMVAADNGAVYMLYVPSESSEDFRMALEVLLEERGVMADYGYADGENAISFFLDDVVFDDFEALLSDYGVVYEGDLFSGIYLTIVFDA